MNQALSLQAKKGGRFGDHLIAAGAITQQAMDAFISSTPGEPDSLAATRIDENELVSLLLKLIYIAWSPAASLRTPSSCPTTSFWSWSASPPTASSSTPAGCGRTTWRT
jgi:hypothetical protein